MLLLVSESHNGIITLFSDNALCMNGISMALENLAPGSYARHLPR